MTCQQTKNQNGQTMVMTILWLPVMTVASCVCFRAGQEALIHQQAQRFLDRRTLEVLAIQAKAIKSLGDLNPYAKVVIETRRMVDAMLKAATLPPPLIPELLAARQVLAKTQTVIAFQQKMIKSLAQAEVFAKLHSSVPRRFKNHVSIHSPLIPPRLRVEDDKNYKGETGAPQVLSRQFSEKQVLDLSAQIKTSEFVKAWKIKKSTSDMTIKSFARIEMKDIESSWTVQIRSPQENPL